MFLFASGFLRAVQVFHQHVFSGGGTDSVHPSTQDRLPVHLLGTTGKKTVTSLSDDQCRIGTAGAVFLLALNFVWACRELQGHYCRPSVTNLNSLRAALVQISESFRISEIIQFEWRGK